MCGIAIVHVLSMICAPLSIHSNSDADSDFKLRLFYDLDLPLSISYSVPPPPPPTTPPQEPQGIVIVGADCRSHPRTPSRCSMAPGASSAVASDGDATWANGFLYKKYI